MILLSDLIALREEWLVNRVFNLIRESGFYKYIPFKEEKWLQFINCLSASFRSALQGEDRLSQLSSCDDYINPAIIMMIFKYYRQVVLELILQSDFDKSHQLFHRDITERLLERMEISYCKERIISFENKKTEGMKTVNSNVKMHGSTSSSEISALLEGTGAILKYQDLKFSARVIFESCKNLIGANTGCITLLKEDGTKNEILFLDTGDIPCQLEPYFPAPVSGLRREVYQTARVVFENDFHGSEWFVSLPPEHLKIENVLFAPLNINTNTVGLLGLANKPGGFSEGDARIASAFGELAALALYNSKNLEMLKKSEEQFRSVAQSATDAIISVNNNGRITFWNQAAEKMFGYPAVETINGSLTMIMPERFHKLHKDGMERQILKGKRNVTGKIVELYGKRKDGSEFPLALSISTWQTGEGIFFSGIIRDITDRKRAEEKLRSTNEELESIIVELKKTEEELRKQFLELQAAKQEAEAANSAKNEFVANISHEIRTPMNSIIGMTELLLDTPLEDNQRQLANIVSDSANSLLNVINDILDFSKMEAVKISMENINFSPVSLVEGVAELMAVKAQENKLNLVTSIEPAIPPLLKGDPVRLRQVLINLIGNAIKFTEKGWVELSLKMSCESDQTVTLRFEVKDTGIGLDEELHLKVFQPFVQVDGSTTRRYGGTGLGLPISKQIVEMMGGKIGVVSNMYKGSTFWFTVTMDRSNGDLETPETADSHSGLSPEEKEAEQVKPNFTGVILVVEDDPVLRKLTLLQLQKLGYIAKVVSSGREAVDAVLNNGPYDLVLMDFQMPHMDGFQATRAIREGEQNLGRHVPIIAITAHAMQGDREQCLSAGMDDYLSKPVKLCQLQQMISRWIVPKEKNKEKSVLVATDELGLREAVNLKTLENLRQLQADGGSDLLIKELIDIYLSDTPPRLTALQVAGEQRKAEALSFAAHTLKSSSANIGALRLSVLASELEALGRTGCIEETDVKILQVKSEYERVRSELLQIRATLKG